MTKHLKVVSAMIRDLKATSNNLVISVDTWSYSITTHLERS